MSECKHEFEYCGLGNWTCLSCKETLDQEDYTEWFTDNLQSEIERLTARLDEAEKLMKRAVNLMTPEYKNLPVPFIVTDIEDYLKQ